jgi:glycosyltransferase involved in cell wall biosynthesis
MYERKKFSILIPCFNEGKSLGNLLSQIIPLQHEYDLEIILIENGSTDKSIEFFRKIEGCYKNVQIVFVEKNRGYGYGIQQGLKVACGDYVGWVHADLQVPPSELKKFFDYIEDLDPKNNLFIKGKRLNRSFFDLFFTAGQSVFNTILFGYRFQDIGAIPTIFSRTLVDDIEILPNDFSIELFLYLQAMRNNFTIKRIPVPLVERNLGSSSWNNGLKSKLKQSKRIIDASLMIKKNKKVL